MPACLVQQQHRVHTRRQGLGKAREEEVHGHSLRGQHEGKRVVAAETDGGEDVGRGEALVAAPRRALTAGEPAMASAPFLALAGFVFTPDLKHLVGVGRGDRRQFGSEVFYRARAPRDRPWDARAWPPDRTGPCDTAAAKGQTAYPDAITVLQSLFAWFDDYNEHHPHKGLRMRSPREFIRGQSQPAPCPV